MNNVGEEFHDDVLRAFFRLRVRTLQALAAHNN